MLVVRGGLVPSTDDGLVREPPHNGHVPLPVLRVWGLRQADAAAVPGAGPSLEERGHQPQFPGRRGETVGGYDVAVGGAYPKNHRSRRTHRGWRPRAQVSNVT